ncbi:triose-phosphate transporter family protein [Nitzschia inconspicua]|uniref:Triose-phosphate transporter family protein n=1 Tax=Nitzschia inconspicua TaxID=303405 RepID=A0A9K3PRI3_9STRA|nr:triose-phosphate transporter family protein [Nitzschia inconspicua]
METKEGRLNTSDSDFDGSNLLSPPSSQLSSIVSNRFVTRHVDEKKQDVGDMQCKSNGLATSTHEKLLQVPGRTAPRTIKYKESDSSIPSGSADGENSHSIIHTASANMRKRKRRRQSSNRFDWRDLLPTLSSSFTSLGRHSKLVVAVVLWYSLGVVSISTSKVLLTPYSWNDEADDDKQQQTLQFLQHVGGVPPLWLTLQQLLLGSTFLRFLLSIQFLDTPGLYRMEKILAMAKISPCTETEQYRSEMQLLYHALWPKSNERQKTQTSPATLSYLIQAGICFSMGFLATNLAFGVASPAFVETVKAAEPITSAILAVAWKIDTMTPLEVTGLAGIISGVVLSTLGGSSKGSGESDTSTLSMFMACGIVMTSNLCFSLRGLYQKLFRRATATNVSNPPIDSKKMPQHCQEQQEPKLTTQLHTDNPQLDDLNLQFRMQQTGVYMLCLPALLWEGPSLLYHGLRVAAALSTPEFLTVLSNYFALAIINGLAFSSYNLASTYLLTRISVVHHAALNCTRRIFAIVCTSILFAIPIPFLSALGITTSFLSFMVFTYAKTIKSTANNKV